MPTIGLYFPKRLSKEDVNTLRARLNAMAATHGYFAKAGPTFNGGNLAAMLEAIDAGYGAVFFLPRAQMKLAIEALDQLAADLPPDNWAEAIAASLRGALERRRS